VRQIGLQSFPRWVWNALASTFYWDLDMVNSHPSILYSVLKNNLSEWLQPAKEILSGNNVGCDRSPDLKENSKLLAQIYPNFHSYIHYREEILSEISENLKPLQPFINELNPKAMRKKAKKLVTVFFYGGTFSNWIKGERIDEMVTAAEIEAQFQGKLKKVKEFSLIKLRDELYLISELIWKNWKSPNKHSILNNIENKTFDLLRSKILNGIIGEDHDSGGKQYHYYDLGGKKEYFRFMSHVLQFEEKKCLAVIETELSRNGRYMDVYIHDGGLVRKKYTIKNFKNQLIEFKNLNQLAFLKQESERFASEILWESSFPEDTLRRCEGEIEKQLGYKVDLTIKEMEENESCSKVQELLKCQQESALYKEISEAAGKQNNISKQKQKRSKARRTLINGGGDDDDEDYESDNEFENSLTIHIKKDRLASLYLTRTYEELFHYYEVQNEIAFIKDRGCYVDKDGRVISEENFKRSMPYKLCLFNRKSLSKSQEEDDSISISNYRSKYFYCC
jgi:hypothetical protein